MLDAARERAAMLNEKGALYPWRTINGEEASAYYAAGTAQYHINAAVVFALRRYLDATGDIDFLAGNLGIVSVLIAGLRFTDKRGLEIFQGFLHGDPPVPSCRLEAD